MRYHFLVEVSWCLQMPCSTAPRLRAASRMALAAAWPALAAATAPATTRAVPVAAATSGAPPAAAGTA